MANVTVYVMTVWRNLPTKTSAIDQTNLNHIEQGIKNVTDFVNTLNSNNGAYLYLCQTPFTNVLKTKLDGIAENANNYVLPTASNSTLGGVKVDAETITIDSNGVIHAAAATTELSALTDVDLTNLQEGQILKWDATNSKWINTSEAEVRTQLSLLEDVNITNPTDGQTLRYNGTSGLWENGEAGDVLDYYDTIGVLSQPADIVYTSIIATPVMTGYTAPSGEVIESGHYDGSINYYGWRPFQKRNDDLYDCWAIRNNRTGCHLIYDFQRFADVHKIEIYEANSPEECLEFPATIVIKGSNDNANWTTLATLNETSPTQNKKNVVTIENHASYRYYKFDCTSFNDNSYCTIGCINMFEIVPA